jgi:hypothetical protein
VRALLEWPLFTLSLSHAHAVQVATPAKLKDCTHGYIQQELYFSRNGTHGCRLAEAGVALLWERKAARWHAITALCTKELHDGSRGKVSRYTAAQTLAPWGIVAQAHAPALSDALKASALEQHVIQPLGRAAAAEDRCVVD